MNERELLLDCLRRLNRMAIDYYLRAHDPRGSIIMPSGSLTPEQSIENQENDRAEDRGDESRRLAFGIPMQSVADKSGEKRAGDAEKNRDDEATWIFPRHQKLRDSSDDEPDN